MTLRKNEHSLCSLAVAMFMVSTFCATATAKESRFSPRDVSGTWWVDTPLHDELMERGEKGDASECLTCHVSEHTAPEPALTPWAIKHLLIQPKMQNDATASASGGCGPIGTPAQFWYAQFYPFEFVVTSDRIIQFFEKQNERRVVWMNRSHPKHLRPTHMGDSIGEWEGNVLVVDTIGYNSQNLIEPVGVNHRMSRAFHLVERWQRVSANELELEVTYYDTIAWGPKPWGGLIKRFVLQPKMKLDRTPCSSEDNKKFDDQFANPATLPKPPDAR